jgi:hypothetical protein
MILAFLSWFPTQVASIVPTIIFSFDNLLGFIKVGEEETEFRGHMYFHNIYALEIKPNLKSNPGG